jgi:large subunit ribosomal protein L15
MKLHTLTPAKGSVKNQKKRIGRGQGSGKGGTSTKGHKGAQSRSGYSQKRGFEGGQMPLQKRIPKFGFNNINRIEYRGINLDVVQKIVEENKLDLIDPATLYTHGFCSRNELVKILGRGEIKVKIDVKAHAFSASAKSAIEAKGGTATIVKA